MRQKSRAPGQLRKQPEIFCWTVSMRMSRSACELSKGTRRSRTKARTASSCCVSRLSKFRAGLCLRRPRRLGSGSVGGGGLACSPIWSSNRERLSTFSWRGGASMLYGFFQVCHALHLLSQFGIFLSQLDQFVFCCHALTFSTSARFDKPSGLLSGPE